MLRTRCSFNLTRLRAKTKHVLIRELLYANDAALVAHPEAVLQSCAIASLKPALTSASPSA